MTEKVLFIIFSVFAVAGGIGTITRKNVVHGLLFLVFTFLNVAAIFVLTQAYFLAVIQILVYAGAIMVLFFFVIMLLNLRTFPQEEQTHKQRWVALALSILVLAEFVIVLAGITFTSARGGFTPEAISAAGGGTKAFGEALFNDMLLPFEVTSVVLLVAMVGAIILVKREKTAGGATRTWEPGEQPSPEAIEEEV